MASVDIRPATSDDVRALRGKLRESDKAEIAASCGLNPDDATEMSFLRSHKTWAASLDGAPLALFGVAAPSMFSTTGVPWLVGTDALDRRGRVAMVKMSRQYVYEMRKGFLLLENYTDDRHKAAHRWLWWCGFKLEKAAPWGFQGLPFRRFSMSGLLEE